MPPMKSIPENGKAT